VEHLQGRSSTSSRGSLYHHSSPAQRCFALPLAELHKVTASPSLQAAQVPWDGGTTPWLAPLLPVWCHLPPCCGFARPHHPDPQWREVLNKMGPGPGPWAALPATGLALHLVPRSSTPRPGRPARAQCPSLPACPAHVRSGDLKSVPDKKRLRDGHMQTHCFQIPRHNPPTLAISTNCPNTYREENTPEITHARSASAFNSNFGFLACCRHKSAVFARRSLKLNII